MTDPIDLRPARPGDEDELARCWVEFGAGYEALDGDRFKTPDRERSAAWFATRLREPQALWLVAACGPAILGFVEADVWPGSEDPARELMRESTEPVLKIGVLFVDPSARGEGLGRSLMEAAEAWGKEQGATSATVVAIVDSPTAVTFYRDTMAYASNTVGFWKRL